MARQCAEVLSITGGDILELGAGTGRLAATLLESLPSIPQGMGMMKNGFTAWKTPAFYGCPMFAAI